MPRPCSICIHPQRPEIDAALINGASYRGLAVHYGLSGTAIGRHRNGHIAATIAQARAADEQEQGETNLAQIQDLLIEARNVLTRAKGRGDDKLVLSAIDRASKQLELLSRIDGAIKDGPTVNIYQSSEFNVIVATLQTALGPFPEAQLAVADALRRLG